MPETLHLTPMEERVLNAFGHLMMTYADLFDSGCSLGAVYQSGVVLYHTEWAGRETQSSEGYIQRPVLNRFAGRLYSKGLLDRKINPDTYFGDLSSWSLTPLGREILGLPV